MAAPINRTNTVAELSKILLVSWKVFHNQTEVGFLTADGLKYKGNQDFQKTETNLTGKTFIKKFALGGNPEIEFDLMAFDVDRISELYTWGRQVGGGYELNGKNGVEILGTPWTFYPIFVDAAGNDYDANPQNPLAIRLYKGVVGDDLEFDSKSDGEVSLKIKIEGMGDLTKPRNSPGKIGNQPDLDYMALYTRIVTTGAGYTSAPTATAVGGATFVFNVDTPTGKLTNVAVTNPGTSTTLNGWQTLTLSGGGATTQATVSVFFG
jgi:hypothetical protein